MSRSLSRQGVQYKLMTERMKVMVKGGMLKVRAAELVRRGALTDEQDDADVSKLGFKEVSSADALNRPQELIYRVKPSR